MSLRDWVHHRTHEHLTLRSDLADLGDIRACMPRWEIFGLGRWVYVRPDGRTLPLTEQRIDRLLDCDTGDQIAALVRHWNDL